MNATDTVTVTAELVEAPEDEQALDQLDLAAGPPATWMTDGRDFQAAEVAMEINHYLRQSALSMYEAGRRLAWARAHYTGLGGFQKFIEQHTPLSRRTAYNYIRLAEAMHTQPAMRQLIDTAGVRKALAVAALPKADLTELMTTGSYGDVGLDDLATKSLATIKADLARESKARKHAETAAGQAAARIAELEETLRDHAVATSEEDRWAREAVQRWRDEVGAVLDKVFGDVLQLEHKWPHIRPSTQGAILGTLRGLLDQAGHAEAHARFALMGDDEAGRQMDDHTVQAAQGGWPVSEGRSVVQFNPGRGR